MRIASRAGVTAAALSLGLLACGRLPTTPNDNTWRFLPGHVESLRYAPFRDGRQCWVYLPPGYASSDRRYPVLYLNDGHVAFDATTGMHLNRICEDLIRRGEMKPIIVVAIGVYSDSQRFLDYTPWPGSPFDGYPDGGGGDLYLSAIRDTLKPEVDRRYRTLPDAANTAIGGMSLGGLIAAYAGFAYPNTFGMVAAFSPSYWWGDTTDLYEYINVRGRPLMLRRYYHDTGFPRDNSIRYMDDLLLSVGFILGRDLMSVTVVDAEHVTRAWEQRFPGVLRFLFPP